MDLILMASLVLVPASIWVLSLRKPVSQKVAARSRR